MKKSRCAWVGDDPLYVAYHDEEWGVPVHDDRKLFEFLILEGAQAGLSWITILKKRENYRRALDGFDAKKISLYDAAKTRALLADPGIVRNRLKIAATIQNAKSFLAVQQEFGSFDAYIWQFVGGKPKLNRQKTIADVPAKTAESDAMSKDLAKRGFKFVGSTICYAFMQAVGMVNDHTADCFRRYPPPFARAKVLPDVKSFNKFKSHRHHFSRSDSISHFAAFAPSVKYFQSQSISIRCWFNF